MENGSKNSINRDKGSYNAGLADASAISSHVDTERIWWLYILLIPFKIPAFILFLLTKTASIALILLYGAAFLAGWLISAAGIALGIYVIYNYGLMNRYVIYCAVAVFAGSALRFIALPLRMAAEIGSELLWEFVKLDARREVKNK